GVGERITTSLNKSVADDELSYFSLEAAFPIGVNGTELSIGYGKSDAKPGLETLRLLEFNADSETYFVELYHPFILSRARNLNASVRFEARDSEGELLDIVNTNEKLRSLRISGSYDMVDDAGAVTLVKTTFSQGISAFGGSANDNEFKARDLARYDYSKIDVLFFQLRPINETLSVYLSGGAQYGFNPLVSSEQCGFGGGSFGRAFDSFEISGDHCVNASVELRSMYPNPMKGVDYIQPYGFVDGGKVWLKQAEGVSSISQTGYSAGAGMRAMFLNNVSGYVEVALPINRDVEQAGNRKARVFAGLRAIF
ncbi:MAG: ShlB/FhaC/HecB family hemolysin secretion/activation protein, partial [Sphingomonadales bacterium]|nr:ShlB/FhaC/HecB family hemolysin secretion/activation protein [Sphingomonadales bacterium]